MTFIPTGIVGDARTAVNSSLTDSATNSRTGLTRFVRVSDGRRDEKIEGLPSFIRLRRWELTFADGDMVRSGDTETVANKGLYTVQVVVAPQTISVDTTAYCLMKADASGSPVPLLPTNQTIILSNPTAIGGTQSVTIGAYVYPAKEDLQIRPESAGYEWAAVYADATYSDGSRPREGHQIVWSGLDVPTSTRVNITKPARYFTPISFSVIYFMEAD